MDARLVGIPYGSAKRAISILGTNIVNGLCFYIDDEYFHSRVDRRVNGLLHQLRLKLSPCVQAPLDEADLEALLAALRALDKSMKRAEPRSIIFGDVTVKTCLEQLRAVLADCEALPDGWTCVNPTLRSGGCALVKHTIHKLDLIPSNTYLRPSEAVLALYKLLLNIPATALQLGYLAISESILRSSATEFTYWTNEQRETCLKRIMGARNSLLDTWMGQQNSPIQLAQLQAVRKRARALLSRQTQAQNTAHGQQALNNLIDDVTLTDEERTAVRSMAKQAGESEDSACLAFLLMRAAKLSQRATS